jgi:hypothetical protein
MGASNESGVEIARRRFCVFYMICPNRNAAHFGMACPALKNR